MTKRCCSFLILFVTLTANSQDAVRKVTKNYFRSDPFAGEFSSFLKHLLNDPSITEREFYQRSDTGLFYLHGFYSTHNPFFFKPRKVEVILAEAEMKYIDSLPDKDTVMIYQLIAHVEGNEAGVREIRKEFDRLHKQFSRGFNTKNYQEQKSGESVTSGWYNYFLVTHAVAPVTLAWGITKDNNEAVLNITVRMKTTYNLAVLAAPFIQGM